MVISGVNTVTYNGDGSQTAWPFTFPIASASEIKVQLINADGTTTAVEDDYYVDVVNNTVYYPGYAPGAEPPEADQPPKVQTGQKIEIYREVPMTQEANLGDAWPYYIIEKGLDKLTMICQQIYSYTNRKLDSALASMFQLAGIVTDSGKLQHITDQYNAIDENAEIASTAAATATAKATAAANSATSANNADASATATAAALTAYLDNKTTLTAPAVDATLVISGAAADARVVGGAVESLTVSNTDSSLFKIGSIKYEDGTNISNSARIRTKDNLAKNIAGFKVATNYEYVVVAYQKTDGTYVGFWNGSSFVTSATWSANPNVIFFNALNPNYDYRLVIRRTDLANMSIATDGNAVTFVYSTDKTLSVDGASADAQATGDRLNDIVNEVRGIPITKTVSANSNTTTFHRPFFSIKKGTRVSIVSDTTDTALRISFYYTDGTSVTSKPLGKGINYRAEKDVSYFTTYNGTLTTVTYTFTIHRDESLPVTNFYNKATKISGYVDSGTVYAGYYHSDFIPVALGDKLVFNGYPSTFGTVRAFFYDANKTYKGRRGTSLRADGLYELTIGLDTIGNNWTVGDIYYVAFNMTVNGSETAVMYINDVPDITLAYGQYQPIADMFFNKQQTDYIANAGNVPISGKKIAYNGDSICESRLSAGNTYNGGAYAHMIANIVGGTYSNRGRGGGSLASGTGATRQVVNDVTNMPDDADLICFEGGINDYWYNAPLGSYTESDYSSTLDTTTICGALESIFRQAKVKWVGKPICFVITHKIKSTVYVQNSAGYTWMDVHEKLVGICKKYAIPYYDAFEDSGLNAYDDIQNTNFLTSNASGTPDGCHPNADGYKKYYVPQLLALFNSLMPRE